MATIAINDSHRYGNDMRRRRCRLSPRHGKPSRRCLPPWRGDRDRRRLGDGARERSERPRLGERERSRSGDGSGERGAVEAGGVGADEAERSWRCAGAGEASRFWCGAGAGEAVRLGVGLSRCGGMGFPQSGGSSAWPCDEARAAALALC